MSDLDDFKATYFDECSELLLELEEQFAAIEDGDRLQLRRAIALTLEPDFGQ